MSDRPSLADRAVSVLANIETLEAEKAERERQEPEAWAWNDALGCMHVHLPTRAHVTVELPKRKAQ